MSPEASSNVVRGQVIGGTYLGIVIASAATGYGVNSVVVHKFFPEKIIYDRHQSVISDLTSANRELSDTIKIEEKHHESAAVATSKQSIQANVQRISLEKSQFPAGYNPTLGGNVSDGSGIVTGVLIFAGLCKVAGRALSRR